MGKLKHKNGDISVSGNIPLLTQSNLYLYYMSWPKNAVIRHRDLELSKSSCTVRSERQLHIRVKVSSEVLQEAVFLMLCYGKNSLITMYRNIILCKDIPVSLLFQIIHRFMFVFC